VSEDEMARTDFKSVDESIAAQPAAVRGRLVQVRGAIRKAVPGAEEGISYRMPTYKDAGGAVIHFGAWQQHDSLYPATVIARVAKLRAKEVAESQKAKAASGKKR
jgi:uncharacterized protein YdhG (YjbR/CyaY superfamily)